MQETTDRTNFTPHYNLVLGVFILALLLLMAFYFFPARDLDDSTEGVTRIYFADNISAAHQQLIDEFNRRYQGRIEVVPVDLPFTKFNTNERKDIIARTLRSQSSRVDIFAADQIWMPRFAKWAEPLSSLFSADELADLLPYARTTCYYDGELLGIPLYIDIGVMYYRRDLLQGVPDFPALEKRLQESITWSEFIALREAHFPGQQFYLFQGDAYEGLICNYLEILGGHDGQLFRDGYFQVDTPMARRGCQLMVDLIHRYGLSPVEVANFNENESYAYALQHDIPFFRGWPSFRDYEASPADREKLGQLGMAPFPHFEGYQPATIFGGWNLIISKYSTRKEEALLFLKFIMKDRSQQILYDVGGYLPILDSLYHDREFLKKNPQLATLRDLMMHGVHRPSHLEYTIVSDIMTRQINSALKGEVSVSEALAGAARQIAENGIPVRSEP